MKTGINGNQYGYYKFDKDKQQEDFIPCGRSIKILKRYLDIDTGEQTLRLGIYQANGISTEHLFKRSEVFAQRPEKEIRRTQGYTGT